MKRITKVLSVIISLMMIIGLLLPVGGVASAAGVVHTVADTADLTAILASGSALADGDTIQLTDDIEYKSVVSLSNFSTDGITIDLNGWELLLEVSGTVVLDINNTILNIEDSSAAGTGELIIQNTSTTGVRNGVVMRGTSQFNNIDEAGIEIIAATASISIAAGTSTITNATGDIGESPIAISGGAKVTIDGDIDSSGDALTVQGTGSAVTVKGNITSLGSGLLVSTNATATVTGRVIAAAGATINAITASAGGTVTVTGNVGISGTSVGNENFAIRALTGATVDITGNVNITGTSDAVNATDNNTSVTVTGDISGNIRAATNAEVDITGNITGNVGASSSSEITVTGNITAAGVVFAVSSNGATIDVVGNINISGTASNAAGIQAQGGATVTLTGNIANTGTNNSIGVHLYTASGTTSNSEVRVSGTIAAQRYIMLQTGSTGVIRREASFDTVTQISGVTYRQYTGTPGTVLVLAAAGTVTGNTTVPVPFTQTGETITLSLDNPLITNLINTTGTNNVVRIDFTTVPATTVSIIPDFFKQVNTANKTLQLDFPQGAMTFNAGAISTLAGQTGTANIEISLHRQNVSALPAAQRNAINESTDDTYSIAATQGSTSITSFGTTGSISIVINYSGPFPAEVYHVSSTGARTLVTSTTSQANNTISFSRNQLSIFIIRHSPDTSETPGPDVPQTSDDVSILILGLIALAAVGGLITLVIIKKRHMTGNRN